MGYACPVCETPQADGRHLANHLAFTAMIHGDGHEAWLAEHAPGWDEAGERELAARVIESATEIEFPPTEGERERGGDGHGRDDHGHSHDTHGRDHDQAPGGGHGRRNRKRERERSRVRNRGSADIAIDTDVQDIEDDESDVASVLAEARELTRRTGSANGPANDGEESGPNRESESSRDEDGRNEAGERGGRSDGERG